MRKWWGYTTTCKWLLWLGLLSLPALATEKADTVFYWRQHQLWPAHDLVSLKPVTPRQQADGGHFPHLQVFSLERLHFLTLNPRLDLRYQPAPHGKALSVSLSADPVLPGFIWPSAAGCNSMGWRDPLQKLPRPITAD